MNDADLQLVRERHPDIPQDSLPGIEPTAVQVACNHCGHVTEAVAVLQAIGPDWVIATFTDEQAQIRDDHCKETTP